jgi:lysozyme
MHPGMLDANYLDAIKQFEGYAAQSRWDYAQNTNGYGTRARFAGEIIDKAEADQRFADEIKKAADFVEKFAPGLDEGSKAALTSLTYNAGTAWTQGGLGQAVASGDLEKAQSIFLQYNKAGGSVLDGLVQRRLQEVAWFGQGSAAAAGQGGQLAASATTDATVAASDLAGPRLARLDPTLASAAPLLSNAGTGSGFATTSGSLASAGGGISSSGAFANLGSDPVLLSLLTYLAKNHSAVSGDDQSRKSQSQAQSV